MLPGTQRRFQAVAIGTGRQHMDTPKFGSGPHLFAARQTRRHLGLKFRRPVRDPFALGLKDQRAAARQTEVLQPFDRLVFRSGADGNRYMDRDPAPSEVCRQQNQVRLVGSHPFRKRTLVGQPAANELLTWIDWTVRVDAAFVRHAESTGVAWENIMTANIDLQPAVATGGAFRTSPADARSMSRH